MTQSDSPQRRVTLRRCAPDSSACWRTNLFPLLLLLLVLSIIYANSFHGAWVFDDHPNIVSNPYVHMEQLDRESITRTFESVRGKSFDRPFAYLTFGLNHFFHGLDTWGYHLVNLIVHCVSAVFLYLFIFHTLRLPRLRQQYGKHAGSIALLAAVLWASHPIMVTSVTYIVQRMASMAGMFFIMAMFFYLMGRTSSERLRQLAWFALCLLAGLLSLATKENAAMLPVCLYLFEVLLIQGVTRRTIRRQILPGLAALLLLLIAAFLLTDPLRILSGYANREFTLTERLLTQPRILLDYLSLMLYPVAERLTLIYEVELSTSLFSPWSTLPAILFWMGWMGLGVYLADKRPLISFCLLFFVINHLIESTFIPLELVYEHRNYIPAMTLFLLISMGATRLLNGQYGDGGVLRALFSVMIVVTLIGYGLTVVQRNALFADPLLLWADNTVKSPGLSRVHTNLGRIYRQRNLQEQGLHAYTRALEVDRWHRHASRAVPNYNLGLIYLDQHDHERARHFFEEALAIRPRNLDYQFGLAQALIFLGELETARRIFETLVDFAPDDRSYRALYSVVLFKKSEYEPAVREAARGLEPEATRSLPHRVLGAAYTRLGEYERARRYWEQYAQANPRDAEPLLALMQLAELLDDPEQLRASALALLSLRADRSWEALLEPFQDGAASATLISMDIDKVLSLVRQGLALELDGWP